MDSIKENDKRISGMIILNKGIGISSRKEIDNVGRILNVKTGHIGTLDPEATGVLPVLLGNTCKLSKYLIEHDKEYMVKMQFGYETDTLDLEGEKIFKDNEKDIKALINADNIQKVILKVNSFKGKYNQIPPIFSAKKYNGQKLYDIAKKDYDRAYDIAKLKAKEIEIYDIADLKVDYENYILEFKVAKSEESLNKESQEAVEQIISKKYDVNLKEKGIKDIIFVGVTFYGKLVKVARN